MTDWIRNDQKDNVRHGQYYKVVPGNGGNFHVYKSGERIWVPDLHDWPQPYHGYVAPGAMSPNITVPAAAPPAPAPAPVHAQPNGGVAAPTAGNNHTADAQGLSDTTAAGSYGAPSITAPDPSHQAMSNGGVPAPVQGPAHPVPNTHPAAAPSSHPVATGGVAQAASGSSDHVYTVAQGDTLWGIAQAHHMSLSELEHLNPQIKNPDLIHPGEHVNLGGGGGDSAVAHAASAEFPNTSSYQATTAVATPEHKVEVNTGGWANGTGEVPPDPAKNAIVASSDNSTDPLKIKDDHSQTA